MPEAVRLQHPQKTLRPRRRDGVMGRFWRRMAWYGLVAFVCGLFGAGMLLVLLGGGAVPTPLGPLSLDPPDDVIEEPDPAVDASLLGVRLTQSGTDQPFRGSGTPGIRLDVEGGAHVGWLLEGWANRTVSSPLGVCKNTSVHYSVYDWMYQFDADAGRGVYQTVASTTIQRIGPQGDQCLPRLDETGPWVVTLHAEGDGHLAETYRDEEGRINSDPWDHRESFIVDVKPTSQAFSASIDVAAPQED